MTRKYSWSILLSCGIALIAFLLMGQAQLLGQKAADGTVSIAASDSYVYRLEVDGISPELYAECSGLGSTSDVEEQKTVDTQSGVVWHATPGALRWDNITLKRDSVISGAIWTWRRYIEQGQLPMAFRSGSIVMLGSNSSQEYARWTFRNGWPVKLNFNEGVEELVIAHDGLTLVNAPGFSGGMAGIATKKR